FHGDGPFGLLAVIPPTNQLHRSPSRRRRWACFVFAQFQPPLRPALRFEVYFCADRTDALENLTRSGPARSEARVCRRRVRPRQRRQGATLDPESRVPPLAVRQTPRLQSEWNPAQREGSPQEA